jgi:hypothetical protein
VLGLHGIAASTAGGLHAGSGVTAMTSGDRACRPGHEPRQCRGGKDTCSARSCLHDGFLSQRGGLILTEPRGRKFSPIPYANRPMLLDIPAKT